MSAITAKASRKMKKYAVLTREPRCFLGSFDFSWEQRKFGEVFDCTVPNNTLSRAELSYDEGTVLNVHYGDVLIKYGSVLDVQKDDIPRIPYRCREDFNGALLQDGDVIIADTAEDETTGKACEIGNLQGSAIVSGLHTMVCRPRNRMALGYLGYYLNSNAYHHQLLPLMQGIKVLSLSRSNIQKTSVSYPSAMKEQQLIASYFSQLDNLITLHQRKCALLFSSFQALISMMFTTSTFSWEQRKFSDVVATRRGLTYKPSDIRKNGVRVLRSSNIAEDSFVLSDEDVFVVREAVNIDCVRANDILITAANGSSRLVGKHTIISGIPEESAVHGGFMLLGTTKEPHFVNASMGSSWYRRFIELFVAGGNGAIGNLNKNDLDNQDIAIPSEKEQKKIGSFFRQLDNLITLHQRKCISFTGRAGRLISTVNKKRITSSWEQRKLGELALFNPKDELPQTFEYVDLESVVGTEMLSHRAEVKSSAPSRAQRLAHTGDLFYQTVRPYQKNNYLFEKPDNNYVFSTGYAQMRPYVDGYFLLSLVQSERFVKVVLDNCTGTSYPAINANDLAEIEVAAPSDESEAQKIGTIFRSIDNLITLHQRKPFLMKWRTSDANRNQTNRLVL